MHDKIPSYTATIQEKKLTTLFIPEYATPKKFGANELLSNMLMIGALWHALGLPVDGLIKAVEKRFASKPALLALDIALIESGYILQDATIAEVVNGKQCTVNWTGKTSVYSLPSTVYPVEEIQKMKIFD